MKDIFVEPQFKDYYLFLDDFRFPEWVTWVKLPSPEAWIVVRNYADFVGCITQMGLPKFVSFDHDLDRDINAVVITRKEGEMDGVNVGNGLDCAKWLAEYCSKNNLKFPEWIVHSTSELNSPKIVDFIESIK